ncbi:hypothetical protein [Mesorhizobium mediterraneum]|uniref:hypothetical protein n=1 Tax=Mesorhizobium mediterraneum TaxID=43617 RepID=UPI0017806A14|nr:hypothetical protein [Mesorhizobium mediterraneum]
MKTLLTCALLATLLQSNHSIAGEATHRLFGLFCNTEAQLDETLAHIRRNLSPRAAIAIVNEDAVVCNNVDQIEYALIHLVDIGRVRGLVPLVKYRGTLVGVVVGQRLRPVEPPVTVFFVAPDRLAAIRVERNL